MQIRAAVKDAVEQVERDGMRDLFRIEPE